MHEPTVSYLQARQVAAVDVVVGLRVVATVIFRKLTSVSLMVGLPAADPRTRMPRHFLTPSNTKKKIPEQVLLASHLAMH
jgi:hypothetical protein